MAFLLLVFLRAFWSWSCGLPDSSKDSFLLGIDNLDEIPTDSFADSMVLARDQLGADFIAVHVPWNSIETSPMTYEDPFSIFSSFDAVCQGYGVNISLTIRPIDLVGKTVPSDLSSEPFNSSTMISRFSSMLDYVFGILDPSVTLNLQVGNEIDGYDTSTEPPTFWNEYKTFLHEVTSYVRSNFPGVPVGFTAMYSGLISQPSLFNDLFSVVDVLGVTYYPHDSTNTADVLQPSLIRSEWNNLVSLYSTPLSSPNRWIQIQEAGYETSLLASSSELLQAQFVCEMVHVMLDHSDDLKSLLFVRLNDLSLEDAESMAVAYGLSDNDVFVEYLRTLGLREFGGRWKSALFVLEDLEFEVVVVDSNNGTSSASKGVGVLMSVVGLQFFGLLLLMVL